LNINSFTVRDLLGSYIVTDVCIHNPDNKKNCKLVPEEAQQYGVVITAVWI